MKIKNVFKNMEEAIQSLEIDDNDKQKMYDNILKLKNKKVNIMITGARGCGKSSTINAIFNTNVATVGISVDPEPMHIQKYELGNLILWDSPGLGDGKEKDLEHSKVIVKKLNELDEKGDPLIDFVLVIFDGGSRDLGTSYELINQVIIPNLGDNVEGKILIAINQADIAMKGRYWNDETNQPEPTLTEFLKEKAWSVKKRVKEATDVDVEPIFYSAGCKDGDEQQKPWNLSKLLYFIVSKTSEEKRLSYVDNLSANPEIWEDDDKLIDYKKETQSSLQEVSSCIVPYHTRYPFTPIIGTTFVTLVVGVVTLVRYVFRRISDNKL